MGKLCRIVHPTTLCSLPPEFNALTPAAFLLSAINDAFYK